MSDLIRRKDVYDVLKKVNIREMPIYVFDKLWNGIRDLPSAEPEERTAKVHDVGVLIHKADLQLDMTHPLSMDDLKGMIDEPVWNSNTLKWMLIHRFVDADKPIVWLVSSGGQFKAMTVYDLIKTPLYRMCK